MRGKIAIAAVVGALALGGTAVAAGGPGGMFGPDRQEGLAADLAEQLDGVNANEVGNALDAVAEEKRAEHRTRMAEGIAAELDGVNADQVADALAKHEEQTQAEALERLDEAVENGDVTEEQADEIRERIESGEGPGHGPGGPGHGGPGGPGGPGHHGPGGPGGPGFGPGGPGGPPPTGGEDGSTEGASTTPGQVAPSAA